MNIALQAPIQAEPLSDPAEAEDLRRLDRLADLCLDGAQAVRDRMTDPECSAADCAVLGQALTRLARSVRQTLALKDRLRQARRKAREDQEDRRLRAMDEASGRRCGVHIKKVVVGEAVEKLIDAADEKERVEQLVSDLYERLNDIPLDDPDFEGLPIGVLVAELCQALKVKPDWEVLRGEPWARDEADREVRGSPFYDDEDDEPDEWRREPP